MPNFRFTPNDIADHFAPPDFARGQNYWRKGHVLSCSVNETEGQAIVEADVQGSEHEPYEVNVAAGIDDNGVFFDDECSCPLGGGCKHVVAALLETVYRWQPRNPGAHRGAPVFAPEKNSAGPVLPPELQRWLEQLKAAQIPRNIGASNDAEKKRLLYILQPAQWGREIVLKLYTIALLKNGVYSGQGAQPYYGARAALHTPPRYMTADDQELLRSLSAYTAPSSSDYRLTGRHAARVMRDLLDTGRCHWLSGNTPALRAGPARAASAAWESLDNGAQRLSLQATPPATALLDVTPPWYVDAVSGECGELHSTLPPAMHAALLHAPVLPAQQAEALSLELAQTVPGSVLPLPKSRPIRRINDLKPQPVLLFYGAGGDDPQHFGGYRQNKLAAVRLMFNYRGRRVSAHDPVNTLTVRDGAKEDEVVLMIERDRKTEQRLENKLLASGIVKKIRKVLQHWERQGLGEEDYSVAAAQAETAWGNFMLNELPRLIEAGFKAEYDPDFPYRYAEVQEWFGGVTESSGEDWFALEMGVQIDGERVNLLPLLVHVLRKHPQDFSASALKTRPPDSTMLTSLPDGRRVSLPYARIAPILLTLIELYQGQPLDAEGKLRLSRLDALRLAELQAADAAAQTRWLGGEKLLELGRRLKNFSGITPVAPPTGLRATLRPYQREGLSWLQFLREYGFGGILADDMGLGKTVQTLAHILLEKEAGRLTQPALVVAPTSLVGNWQREAREFTPGLRVLALHGLTRKQHFDALAQHDLIVTTYPLLPRDKEALLKQQFHLLVLDEAQNIKNARTLAAQIAQQLKARHRLCLTGTPMENHLGELWSQFHFLQPGLLGADKQFRQLYRTPIEKQGDIERRAHLVRRIAPFLLRRTKSQVATELPPKTEIVRSVALAGAQRDLYEVLRLAMNEKVREEIANKGLGRSHIIILDALLKLRQCCCDPRLLKLESAKKAHGESAKLTLLMDLLPEMLEEGRRVLLFSQFTSMLELIEVELVQRRISYLKLTGESVNRTQIVERFQAGDAPLFLVSLKAGGVGLNLTAADTVIHYDPWWNPAVENQATDRAHRIGQDKPVFVYKLIVEGSVEEKIMGMQQRKAALAAGILDGGAQTGPTFTPTDLQALFESGI